MEIVISLFAVLVAFSCLYVLVRSDIRDKRKLQMARIETSAERQQNNKQY